jgi:hypothetical protein
MARCRIAKEVSMHPSNQNPIIMIIITDCLRRDAGADPII